VARKTKTFKTKVIWLRAFSTLSINLSAAWVGVATVTPNFVNLGSEATIRTLIIDFLAAILLLLIHIVLELEAER